MVNKKRKIVILIILLIITSTSFLPKPKAAKVVGGSCYTFNSTTGAYTGKGKRDCIKKIDNNYVFCVERGKKVTTSNYSIDTSWNATSREAIIAGILIDKTNAKYSEELEEYAMNSAVQNTFFRKDRYYAAAYNYYDTNSVIKSIYDSAISEYNTYQNTNTLPAITTSENQTFNVSNGVYISDKITISNLLITYGGTNDLVTYTITADKGAKICSKASGIESSCTTAAAISGQNSYSFYVKATSVNPSEVVRVTITGTNQSTYPSSMLYTGGSNTQKLIAKTNVTLQRRNSKSIQLTVPNLTNHTIQARKVNEYGELISGAFLEIYQDTPYTGKKLVSGTSESTITYTSDAVSALDDDFFNHDYYLVETQAPNGFLLNSEVNHFYIKNSVGNDNITETLCYHNGGSDSDDSKLVNNERCNFENYTYKCKGSDNKIIDTTENHDCIFEQEIEEPKEDLEHKDPGAQENNKKEESKITYEKVCYKLSANTIEKDETFCSNKDDYIKLEKRNGNLVVTQPNNMNKLKISKKGITKDKELPGAKLKICTKSEYDKTKEECEPATTIEQIKMEWISGITSKEYQGIPKGDYYIIETIAPNGYKKLSTVTSFSVDSTGKIISNKQELKENTIIIKNQLNSLTISKQDMTTSKELKGATLSICTTYVDENNVVQLEKDQYTEDCIPAILADGTKATWVSTNEPKKIEGLPIGTYYLVENIAPTNYSTAESILFIVSQDGTILDKNGKSIADNKIVMKDQLIKNPKTGEIPIIIISIIGILGLATGITYYYKINSKKNKKISK